MLKRYRIIVVAFGAWLIIGAASPPDESAQSENSNPAAQVAQPAPPVVQQEKESPQYTAPCEPGQDSRNSDLCAQWKAADAARDAAKWAWWQLWIGIVSAALSAIGLIALVYSLLLNRRATTAAVDASAAAREALTSDRAWLCFENATVDEASNVTFEGNHYDTAFAITLNYRNFGLTPAMRVGVIREGMFRDINDSTMPALTIISDDSIRGEGVVPPTGVFHAQFLGIAGDDYDAFVAKKKSFIVHGIVGYRDIFDQEKIRITECVVELTYEGWRLQNGKRVPLVLGGPFSERNRAT